MKNNIKTILIILGILLLYVTGGFFGYNIAKEKYNNENVESGGIQNDNEQTNKTFWGIQNITLENIREKCNYGYFIDKSVKCVNYFVKQNYNYVINSYPDNLTKTIIEGANCKGWNWIFYNKIFRDMGYLTRPLRFDYNDGRTQAHAVLVVYNSRGQCLIDQRGVSCMKIGGFKL